MAAALGLSPSGALRTVRRYLRDWEALRGAPGVPEVRRGSVRGRYEVRASDLAVWCGVVA